MSRIGKKPIKIPSGVTVTLKGVQVDVKGPKGTLSHSLPEGITVEVKDGILQVSRRDDSPQQRAFHGLIRSLVQNMITGCSAGFKKELELIGIGYKAEVQSAKLILNLGYSHSIEYPIPAGIQIKVEKIGKKASNYMGTITVEGIDRQRVGQVAAEIRGFRKPDSYKGKGVRYANEVIKLKESKKTA
jgi:large subunit ribosomal protein L6